MQLVEPGSTYTPFLARKLRFRGNFHQFFESGTGGGKPEKQMAAMGGVAGGVHDNKLCKNQPGIGAYITTSGPCPCSIPHRKQEPCQEKFWLMGSKISKKNFQSHGRNLEKLQTFGKLHRIIWNFETKCWKKKKPVKWLQILGLAEWRTSVRAWDRRRVVGEPTTWQYQYRCG